MRTVKESWGLITTHCLGNELETQEIGVWDIKPTRTGEEMLTINFHWVFEQCLTFASILLMSF